MLAERKVTRFMMRDIQSYNAFCTKLEYGIHRKIPSNLISGANSFFVILLVTRFLQNTVELLWNPNRITPFFNDNKKMKCPFILILTGLNVGPLAATTF